MNNNSYIQVIQKRDGTYEVKRITKRSDGYLNVKSFTEKDTLIMVKTIAKHQEKLKYQQPQKNIFIYNEVGKLMNYFKKEKIRNKKINRIKSRAIATSIALAASISVGTSLTTSLSTQADPTVSSTNIETQIEDNQVTESNDNIITLEYNEPLEEVKEEDNITYSDPNIDNNISYVETMPSIEENNFSYYYDEEMNKATFDNASEYMDTFKKYEAIYGIDANLLCAIGAQESSGVHLNYSANGASYGIMGVEYIWEDASLTAYNFETNSYETITVDFSRITDLDYNIKIGAMIFQDCFYGTLNNNADTIDKSEQLAFTLQKYNMGPGNMDSVLSLGPNWIDNREVARGGDKQYFEHIFSKLDNNTTINIKLIDGSYHTTSITNKALENHYSL